MIGIRVHNPCFWKRSLAVVCASGIFLAGQGPASENMANLRIDAPIAPLQPSCFAVDTETHRGAVFLEEIEGDVVDGYTYGNVFAESGETWGYLSGIQGHLEGAVLSVEVRTSVEGSELVERKQWAFVDGGIVTDVGTYFDADCAPIEEEYIRRVTE